MLAIFVPWAISMMRGGPDAWTHVGFLLFLTPFWAPFVWVFWHLTAHPDALTVKRSLALVGSWAFLVLVPTSTLLWESLNDLYSARTSANAAIIAAIQGALIFASIKTYLTMERRRSDFYVLIPRLGAALVILGCLIAFSLRFGGARY